MLVESFSLQLTMGLRLFQVDDEVLQDEPLQIRYKFFREIF